MDGYSYPYPADQRSGSRPPIPSPAPPLVYNFMRHPSSPTQALPFYPNPSQLPPYPTPQLPYHPVYVTPHIHPHSQIQQQQQQNPPQQQQHPHPAQQLQQLQQPQQLQQKHPPQQLQQQHAQQLQQQHAQQLQLQQQHPPQELQQQHPPQKLQQQHHPQHPAQPQQPPQQLQHQHPPQPQQQQHPPQQLQQQHPPQQLQQQHPPQQLQQQHPPQQLQQQHPQHPAQLQQPPQQLLQQHPPQQLKLHHPQLQHLQHPQHSAQLQQPPQQHQHPPLHLQQHQHPGHDAPQPAAAAPPLTTIIRPSLMTTKETTASSVSTGSAEGTTSHIQADTKVSLPVNMDTECVYRKFGEVIEAAGKIEATDEQVLNVFLQLTKKERKLVMAEGSIRSFLSKCSYIIVTGNTLCTNQPLPSKPEEVKNEAVVEVFKCKESAVEPFEDRAYRCGISLEKEMEDEQSLESNSHSSHCHRDPTVAVACWPDQMTNGVGASVSTTKWSVARGEVTEAPLTNQMLASKDLSATARTFTPLTYAADYTNRMSDSGSPDEYDTHIPCDTVTNNVTVKFVDLRSALKQFKEALFVKSSDPVDTMAKRLVYNAMCGALVTVTKSQNTQQSTSKRNHVLRVESSTFVPQTKSGLSLYMPKSSNWLNASSPEFRPRNAVSLEQGSVGNAVAHRGMSSVSSGDSSAVRRGICSVPSLRLQRCVSTYHSGVQTETPPTISVMTNTRARRTKECGTQTHAQPKACCNVAINTVDSLFDRRFRYHLVPIVAMSDACVNTPKIHVRNIKSQCSVAFEDGSTMSLEDEMLKVRQRTVSEIEGSNVQSAGVMFQRDLEQSTDSTEAVDVSVQLSAKSLKEAACKKQPPGLPNIQQPVKKSKKAKALKTKTPALKAEVSPEETTDSQPVDTATVWPSEATVQPTNPVAATQLHQPEPPKTDPQQVAEVSSDPRVTADMTVSTTAQLQPPTDALLQHMMRSLEKANPALSRDPHLLQMTAMNHMMALQQMQQQQPVIDPQPPQAMTQDPQQEMLRQKQQQLQFLQQQQQQMQLQWAGMQQPSVESTSSSQGGVVDSMSYREPPTQPESVASPEASETLPAPTDPSHSRPPQHWPAQQRQEPGQEPTPLRPTQRPHSTPTKVKPPRPRQTATTEASHRPPKRQPSIQADVPSPTDAAHKQKVVPATQNNVKPAAKVPGFLGRLPRKTTTNTTTTNVPSTSRNYKNGTDNAASTDAGGEDWDAEVDPYATTWTWGQNNNPAPEPVKEPPKPPIPGLVQKPSKKKPVVIKDVTPQPTHPVKVTQAPPTQPQTRPGNFFKKPPTPTLIPITRSSWDEEEAQLNLTDSSAFPGLPSHRQQKRASVSSSMSELSDISLTPAGANSVSALCDIPMSSTSAVGFSAVADSLLAGANSVSALCDIPMSSTSAVGFSGVADSLLGQQGGDILEDFDLTSRVNWQPVVGKKKKGEQSEKQMNSFEKLIVKLREMHPDASQAVLHDAIKQVRQKHAGLKGVHMSQVISDASKIIGAARPDPVGREGGDTSDLMNKINYKTRICQFWQNGTCVQGDQCGYAHGKKELRQMPRKTQMCQNILKGYCQYGDQCTFAHSEEELKKSKPPTQQTKPAPLPKVLRPMKTAEPNPAPTKAPSWGGWSDTSGARPTHVTEFDETEDVECVICCDGIKPKDSKKLECGHVFHDACIRQWVLGVGTRTCPTCRSHALLVEDFPKLG